MRSLPTVLAVLLLAACSPEPTAPPVEPETAAPEVVQPIAAASVATSLAYSPLPSGVILAAPFHVRNDRIYVTKQGATRRRTALELLEGDVATIANDIAVQLTQAGYRAMPVKDRGDGVTRSAFQKKGSGRIDITASTSVGDKPANPDARALITLNWLLKAAPALQNDANSAANK